MKILFKQLPFKQDLILTTINSICLIIGVFFINALIARTHGLDVLGEYLLLRRTSYSFVGVMLVGINISLPAFIAKQNNNGYLESAITAFVFLSVPIVAFFVLLIKYNWITGFEANYVMSYTVYLLGICLQYLVYGLYRGFMNMVGANIFQLCLSAVVPILMFYNLESFSEIISNIGIILIVISTIAILIRNKGLAFNKITKENFRQFLNFGLVRVPSQIAQFFLLAGPPLLIASHVSFEDLSYFNSSLSLVRIFLIIVGPLGILLLPRISKALHEKKNVSVKNHLNTMIGLVVLIGTIMSISLSLIGPELVQIWLGKISDNGRDIVTYLMMVIPFYALVGVLRSPIDASSQKGYNSNIYIISVLAMFITYKIFIEITHDYVISGVVCFIIGYLVASIYSLYMIKKMYGLSIISSIQWIELLISILFTFIIFNGLDLWIMNDFVKVISFILLMSISSIVYLFKSNTPNIKELRTVIFNK